MDKFKIGNSIRCILRIENLEIHDAIDPNLYIIASDAGLFQEYSIARSIKSLPVTNNIHKWQQDAETRTQRGVVFAQTFNNIRTLLWNNYSRLGKQDKYEYGRD